MSLKRRMRRLEHLAEGGVVSIPRRGGGAARFPASDLQAAFLANVRRIKREEVPEHPLSMGAARSDDPRWQGSFFAAIPVSGEVEDLSE